MDLSVDLSGRRDRAAALYEALRDAVRRGRLAAGDRLPASRTLARDLGVSRTTVATVYERLTAEGFLEARVGAGTYVSAVATEPPAPRTGSLRPRPGWRWTTHQVSGTAPVPPYDFRVGIPDASLFPFDTWRRLLAAETRRGDHQPGVYGDPAGLERLREAIARHLAYSRGVQVGPDEVIATQGTQQALDLVARVLVEPGTVVAVEDPGYPIGRDAFAAHGARVVRVPVDAEGMVVDEIPPEARLIYTTPSHQFPLGVAQSLARRRALLAHAVRHGAAVVEDDYDSEFRHVARPLETLHGLDASGHVVYVGTFSKSLLPSLRLGYLVCPPSLRDALLAARQLTDGYGPVHLQAALARFIDEGLLARHVRRALRVYGDRRDLLLEELAALPVSVVPCAAGLHFAAYTDVDATAVAERARSEGIAIEALSAYGSHPREGLVFGYGAVVTDSIRPGIRRLARLLASAPSASTGPTMSTTPAPTPRSPATR